MNTIKINDVTLDVESYSKSTSFMEGMISSTGYCTVYTTNITALHELMEDAITSIQIYHDQELIYNLDNINAQINSINEYLNGDRIAVSVNFIF